MCIGKSRPGVIWLGIYQITMVSYSYIYIYIYIYIYVYILCIAIYIIYTENFLHIIYKFKIL